MTGDLSHGYGLRVPARSNPLDHHVAGDDPLKAAIFPAHRQHCHAELAHPVARLPQGLFLADVLHVRFRGLSRAGHRDPPPPFPTETKDPRRFPVRLVLLRMVVPGLPAAQGQRSFRVRPEHAPNDLVTGSVGVPAPGAAPDTF